MTLSACKDSGTILPPDLPRPSKEVISCLEKTVDFPRNVSTLSKQKVLELISDFRKNDVSKTLCGRRVVIQTNETLDAVEIYIKGLR